MHQIILAAAFAALAAGSAEGAPAADDTTVETASEAEAWSINETSWEFTQNGRTMQNSIDASGNYVINAGSEHVDHGVAVMKDGKVCTTSAMTQDGETCWTVPQLDVGASGEVVGDNGAKLSVKRVAYAPPTM